MTIDHVLPALACPHCGGPLTRSGGVLTCPDGHHFDVARQGYVSLLGPHARTDTGDSAEMVAARVAFLGAGHYAPIAAAVSSAVTGLEGPAGSERASVLVEIGAGTGYYLAAALDAIPGAVGVALDSSSRAARRAASAHPAIGSVVADAWSSLPLADAAADVVLSVFAPRNPAELSRILRDDGLLVVVTPAPDHLGELIGPLGMLTVGADKDSRLAASLEDRFVPVSSAPVRFTMALGREDLRHLVLMGPAARHLDRAELAAGLDRRDPVTEATATVTVSSWRSR